MEDFKHDPLEDPSQQIRLLRILPADRREHVTVTVETFQRHSAPPYAALSYAWEDQVIAKRILANGKLLDITKNCWYALGQLRLLEVCEYYWIDFICINQQDAGEKSAQVNIMGDTFRNAISTVVSLGRPNKQVALFLEQMMTSDIHREHAEFASASEIPDRLKALDETSLERLSSALVAFANLPYWNRLWIAQEFALSSRLVLACGTTSIEWSHCVTWYEMICKALDVNKDFH